MPKNNDASQKAQVQTTPLMRRPNGATGFAVAPMLDGLDCLWFCFIYQ
jgi:hypothetical protein